MKARGENPKPSRRGQPVPLTTQPVKFRLLMGDPDPVTGCMEWKGPRYEQGYGIWREGGYMIGAHRISLALHLGHETPGNRVTRHRCDNPPCVNPKHLELGEPWENDRDRVIRFRSSRGSKHHATHLNEADVIRLRAAYKDGASFLDVMDAAGIGQSGTASMLIGQTWSHVPGAVTLRPRVQVRGEEAGLARLREADVLEARDLYRAGGVSYAQLASRFRTSKSALRQAITGVTWGHLPGAVPAGTRGATGPRGEQGGNTTLTAETVLEIRRRRAAGARQVDLAKEFDLSARHVSKIVRREIWSHLPEA